MADFTYESDENHVERRPGLSTALRGKMFDTPRAQWAADPRFHGEPAFWLHIHEQLLRGSSTLAQWAEALCNETDEQAQARMANRVSDLGKQMVHHAHGHHHIEDHHFFPAFLRIFPQLEHPLELLDGDHKVLGEVLDDLETAVTRLSAPAEGGEQSAKDHFARKGEAMQRAAARLDALFVRHINDEEEICVPAMLKL